MDQFINHMFKNRTNQRYFLSNKKITYDLFDFKSSIKKLN